MEFESSIASHRATPVFVEIWIIRDLQNFSNYKKTVAELFNDCSLLSVPETLLQLDSRRKFWDFFLTFFKASLTLPNKNPLKSCEFIQGKCTRFSCPIHQIFKAKTKGIFIGSTYENTIKKAMKILWRIPN